MKNESNGMNRSERFLSSLGERAFLSLWRYMNLYTDEGRRNGKSAGMELCDMLVVFGKHVLIFSVKDIAFNRKCGWETAWARWYKKAIDKSAKQVFGAEAWLRKHPERIFLDPKCEKKFPLTLPAGEMKIHRICIALGVRDACAEYYGGDTGSLMLKSKLNSIRQHTKPFVIGQPDKERGFVHVFDDLALNAVFSENDTVADFIAYLSKRELFLSRQKPDIMACGEEELLALYLTDINEEYEHDFILPDRKLDAVFIDLGSWEGMIKHKQYIAKKQANEISYLWDRLIQNFINTGRIHDEVGRRSPKVAESASALRHMAAESRLRRRQLADGLHDLAAQLHYLRENNKVSADTCNARIFVSNDFPNIIYMFLVMPHPSNIHYDQYRANRQFFLTCYCKAAKLEFPVAKVVVGVAVEPIGTNSPTEDLVVLDVENWTAEMEEEARALKEEYSLLEKVSKVEGRDSEYPNQ